jgi:F0F1-type ATP synthase membrane subunit c/vacuolar-type H+-ATPase subunit K
MKVIGLSLGLLPIAFCSLSTGIMFGQFVRSVGFAPDLEDTLFSLVMMGFALIETFMVISFFVLMVIFSL